MNRVFFIVPVYKVEKYLKRCVESILAQTYKNRYIILVDDGSPDECPKICDAYADENDDVEVIHKQNGGLSDARNVGLARCMELGEKDDYVAFVDSDDYLRTDFAEKLVEICSMYGCDIAQCEREKGSSDKFSSCGVKGKIEVISGKDALLGYRLKTQITTKIYKLNLLNDEKFPVDKLNEDEFLIYRLAYKAKSIGFTDEKLFYYFQRSDSIMDIVAKGMKNNSHRYDWMWAYIERIVFFQEENEPDQILRTYEKICTDIILRSTEQLHIKREDRDPALNRGEYIRTYRNCCKKMLSRKGMPLKRKLMYIMFYCCPYSAYAAEKLVPLRK